MQKIDFRCFVKNPFGFLTFFLALLQFSAVGCNETKVPIKHATQEAGPNEDSHTESLPKSIVPRETSTIVEPEADSKRDLSLDDSKPSDAKAATSLPKISVDDFLTAAMEGDASTVKRGVRQGIPVDAAAEDKRTALMLASFNGFSSIVDYLLENKANVEVRDTIQRTALMYASTGPYAETVQLLVDAGANVNAADAEESWTPLMFAAAEGQVDVVKILLKYGADASKRDVDGDTALQFALSKGHQAVVELLSK